MEEVYRTQLRALWTAYCLHYDLCVDTADYDAELMELWLKITEMGRVQDWYCVEDFESFMCELLV